MKSRPLLASLQFLPAGLKTRIRLLFDRAVLASCQRKPGPRKVGGVLLLHGLGDLLIGAGAVEALHDHLGRRGLRSRLFVDEGNVEFARAYLRVDEVVGLHWLRFDHDPRYRWKRLRALAASGEYAVVYQPTVNRRLTIEDSLMRAMGAPERVGLDGTPLFIQPWERDWGDGQYSQLVRLPPQPRHDQYAYADFLAAVGIEARLEPWRLSAGGSALSPREPFMVISDQASNDQKRWPLERFLQVAEQLATPRQWKVVAVGWPEARAMPESVIDLRGKTDGAELPRLLGDARFILSNDSGPLHLGMALGKPTVAVGGGGMPERYFPYPYPDPVSAVVVERRLPCAGCGWHCGFRVAASGVASCVDEVTPGQVLGVAEALLQRMGL